jgi:hypothetical protein
VPNATKQGQPSGSRRERRRTERSYATHPVLVRGADAEGCRFRATTVVDDLSAGGLYMQLPQRVNPGAPLLMEIRFVDATRGSTGEWLRIASRGIVRRAEERPPGLWGLGVEFTSYRLLQAIRSSTSEAKRGANNDDAQPSVPRASRAVTKSGSAAAQMPRNGRQR